MRFEQFKALREAIQRETLTRQQIGELLGDVTARICRMPDVPELEAVQHDLSEACEAYAEALELIDEREGRNAPPDPCDLARDRALRDAEEQDLVNIARHCGAL